MKATHLNISALAELVSYHGGHVVMPNEVPRSVSIGNHIKRCQKAGLFVVEGRTLKLTPEGFNAVMAYMEKELLRWKNRGFGTGTTEQMYRIRANAMSAAYMNLGGDPSKAYAF